MKRFLFILTGIVLFQTAFSQSIEINDVKRSRFEGVYPILSGKERKIEGYYTYYMKERAKKGMRVFEFALIDKGVTKTVTTQIQLHKFANINNTVFNGKYFLISWDDIKNKKLVYNIIDRQGKIVTKKSYPVEKKSQVKSTVYADESGDGFYIVSSLKRKKTGFGYSLQKVNNELEKVWKKDVLPEKGFKAVADLVNTKERFVIWEEYGPKYLGKVIKPRIACYDASNGDLIFERDGYDGVSTILNNQLRIDNDGYIYAGGAYVDGEKYKSVNNAGIYLLKLDPNGKDIIYTKVNNEEQIQSALKATSKGFTVGSKDKVFVEDLLLDGDNIIVISEMFRKNLNVTPAPVQQARDLISGKYIGWARDKDKKKVVFEVMDFMLFKFDKEGKLQEIKPINKEKYTKITCWYPYYSQGGQRLAKTLSNMGWFDFCFIETDINGNPVMVCKDNAEVDKQDKGVIGKILDNGPSVFTYTLDSDYAQKKLNLKQQGKINLEKGKVGYFNVLRNDKGKMANVYYQAKLKKITINLESLH